MLRFPIRVKPGASRPRVGGRFGADGPGAGVGDVNGVNRDALVVAVAARAVDGAANRAVIEALAAAFGVRRADVEIVAGASGRSKLVTIDGDDTALGRRLAELLAAADRRGQ